MAISLLGRSEAVMCDTVLARGWDVDLSEKGMLMGRQAVCVVEVIR